MPKKTESRGQKAAAKKWGDVTAEDLASAAEKLREKASSLDAIRERVDAEQASPLRVNGVTKFSQAMKILRDYERVVEMGLARAKFRPEDDV